MINEPLGSIENLLLIVGSLVHLISHLLAGHWCVDLWTLHVLVIVSEMRRLRLLIGSWIAVRAVQAISFIILGSWLIFHSGWFDRVIDIHSWALFPLRLHCNADLWAALYSFIPSICVLWLVCVCMDVLFAPCLTFYWKRMKSLLIFGIESKLIHNTFLNPHHFLVLFLRIGSLDDGLHTFYLFKCFLIWVEYWWGRNCFWCLWRTVLIKVIVIFSLLYIFSLLF